MNKAFKCVAVAAAALLAMGLLLTGFAFALGAPTQYYWNGGLRLSSDEIRSAQSIPQQSLSSFTSLDIKTGIYQVRIDQTGSTYGISYTNLQGDPAPRFRVEGGTLQVDAKENHKRFPFMNGWNGRREAPRTITIYLPSNAKVERLDLDCDMGDFELRDFTANYINLDLDLGEITLDNVQVKQLEVSADMGDVQLDNCTAETASLDLNLGSLNASNLRTSALEVDSDAGEVILDGEFKGITTISNSLGTIRVTNRLDRKDFGLTLKVDLGDITVDGVRMGNRVNDESGRANQIHADANCGDIQVNFR